MGRRYDHRIMEIADHYGYDAQSRQLIEEMAELTQAINKFWRKQLNCGRVEFTCDEDFQRRAGSSEEMSQIIQEMADVEIGLMEMRYMLERDDNIDLQIEWKIRRQIKRIQMEEENGICADDDRRLAGDQR